jgi:hypothetical protein
MTDQNPAPLDAHSQRGLDYLAHLTPGLGTLH